MMKAYPKYKGSKVKWLDNLPEHWQDMRVKFFLNKKNDNNVGELWNRTQLLSLTQKGVIKKDINTGAGKTHSDYSTYQTVEPEDLVFCLFDIDETPRTVGLSELEGMITSAYTVFECNEESDKDYLYYFFESVDDCKGLKPYYSGMRKTVRPPEFLNIKIPKPPLAEQKLIGRFLKSETTRISNLIAEKENFIKLLSEKRQALISHVVTKGLNPNVPMKDSGVEWIGEIPEHWIAKPIKYLGTLNPNKSELSKEYLQKTCSFVPMTKLKTDSLMLDEVKPVLEVFDGYTYFKDEDVLFAKVTPCFENKNMCIAKNLDNGIGFGSSEINVFRVNKLTDNRYFYYLIQEEHFMQFAKSNMTGTGGLKRVPSEVILDYKVAIPSVEEQREIADYLESKFKKLNELTNETNKSIELLKEHRTALISAAVTGKIDVREEV